MKLSEDLEYGILCQFFITPVDVPIGQTGL